MWYFPRLVKLLELFQKIYQVLGEKFLIEIYTHITPELRNKLNRQLKSCTNHEIEDIREFAIQFYDVLIKVFAIEPLNYVSYKGKKYVVDNNSKLSITGKRIKKISEIDGLAKLSNLRTLELCGNRFTEIDGLDSLINLEHLNLANNRIVGTKGLGNLKKLKYLNFYRNEIRMVEEMKSLYSLETLNLSNNQISTLKGLNDIKNLKWVDFSNNNITEIDENLTLQSLVNLRLEDNRFYTVPKSILNLPSLKSLSIPECSLSEESKVNLNILKHRGVNIAVKKDSSTKYVSDYFTF